MAKPKDLDKRDAILAAATCVIAAQGMSASTAAIAKEAGVSNGSLFVYFDTKVTLVNELFVGLKTELSAAALDGLAAEADDREQLLHVWNRWMEWATAFPEKRRTLSYLDVSDDVTEDSHRLVSLGFANIAQLLERSRADGPLRDATLGFVFGLLTAVAESTVSSILGDPIHADVNRGLGFDAVWRMIAATPAS